MTATTNITKMLDRAAEGDAAAADELLPLVYAELRALAASHMQRERLNHTLQPTAVVHEAYLRLIKQNDQNWQNRAHFMAISAEMIRRILVDHARSRNAAKRGGGEQHQRLTWSMPVEADSANEGDVDLIALNDALEALAKVNDRHRRVVELRFFGGLSIKDTAEVLGVSPETVKLDWRTARAWLRMRLQDGDSE